LNDLQQLQSLLADKPHLLPVLQSLPTENARGLSGKKTFEIFVKINEKIN
jgi:hypothetical protein